MPSKRDPCLVAVQPVLQPILPAPATDAQRDFLARDVEELVSEIKENLRLKARPRRTPAARPTPYGLERRPPAGATRPAVEDPYEMLQRLLDSNSLVAEAVRRLREGLRPDQKPFFYDDEDEGALLYPISY